VSPFTSPPSWPSELRRGGLRARIQAIAADERPGRETGLTALLTIVSVFYGGLQRLRRSLYADGLLRAHRLPCRVVCIGNLTLGGTGKTPLTMDVARRLQRHGLRPAVLSRGYKGRWERRGGIVSDGRTIRLGPREAGDEPVMMARRLEGVPVIVGADRYRAGLLAWRRFRPDCLVLDDGFQHLRLARDLNVVLLDFWRPFGNGLLLPRGTLREPVEALRRADAVVLTRSPAGPAAREAAPAAAAVQRYPHLPHFFASHTPTSRLLPRKSSRVPRPPGAGAETPAPIQQPRRAFVFSGIARNDDVQRSVAQMGHTIVGARAFADHHDYSHEDLAAILTQSKAAGAELLVTTEKDHARLSPQHAWPLDLLVLGVTVCFGSDEPAFDAFLRGHLLSVVK
jgi:tetraacyldisaccharide 4'-kinase